MPSNGTAAAATKLSTARTIRTNLGSTSAASFNGTSNVTPGITGTLGISNGGTSATTAEQALANLGGLPKSGGTMTGYIDGGMRVNATDDIVISHTITTGTEPKFYFFKHNNNGWFVAGEGDVNVGESNAVNFGGVASPVHPYDAANKRYVDSSIIRTNLLDNAYFVNPVNQRGKISYTNEMSIDRWKIDGGTLTVEADGINISRGENSTSLRYITETDLFGKTITFSVLTANNELFTGTGVIQKGSDWTNYNIIFSNDIIQLWLQQVPTGLYSFNIYFLQNRKLVASNAELGEFQTLAHREGDTWVLNDPPPDRALELLKCQRYQFVPTNNISHFGIIGYGDADTPSTIQFTVPLPACLRTSPSISMTGTYEIRGNGLREFFNANDVTITKSQHSPHYAHIDIVNLPSSITLNPWNIYMLVNAGDNNNIIIDANL